MVPTGVIRRALSIGDIYVRVWRTGEKLCVIPLRGVCFRDSFIMLGYYNPNL